MVRKSNKDKSSSSKDVVVEHHHVDEMHHRMALAGAAIVFILVVLAFSSYVGKDNNFASVDQFIYIQHETCPSCVTLEPAAREAAELLGVPFTASTYNKEVPFPGFVLVYNDIVYISGFQQPDELLESLCAQTANARVCERAENQKAIEQQTT